MGTVKLNISLDCYDCSDESVAAMGHSMNLIRDAMGMAAEQNGNEIVVTKNIIENVESISVLEVTPEVRLAARVRELVRENDTLKQLLLDADEVARRRGDKHGLCDAIDNDGAPYPSASCFNWIEEWKRQGRRPMLFLDDLK